MYITIHKCLVESTQTSRETSVRSIQVRSEVPGWCAIVGVSAASALSPHHTHTTHNTQHLYASARSRLPIAPERCARLSLPTRGVSFRTNRIVLSSADDGDADERSAEAKAEDDALAAAFNARLQKEGGATQVRELNACMC